MENILVIPKNLQWQSIAVILIVWTKKDNDNCKLRFPLSMFISKKSDLALLWLLWSPRIRSDNDSNFDFLPPCYTSISSVIKKPVSFICYVCVKKERKKKPYLRIFEVNERKKSSLILCWTFKNYMYIPEQHIYLQKEKKEVFLILLQKSLCILNTSHIGRKSSDVRLIPGQHGYIDFIQTYAYSNHIL